MVLQVVKEYFSSFQVPYQYPVGNFIGYGVTILINYLSVTGKLGKTNADLSSANETPITPAGWTFGIWALIFALEGLGSLFGVVKVSDTFLNSTRAKVLNEIGHGWQLGWLFQTVWQLLFLVQTPLCNFVCFLVLLGAYVSFGIPLINLYKAQTLELFIESPLTYTSYVLPTTLNTAWLNAATLLGLLISLKSFGVPPGALKALSIVLVIATVILGVGITTVVKDIAYSLTLIWAIQGIRLRHNSDKVVSWTSLTGQIVLLLGIVFQIVNQISIKYKYNLYGRLRETINPGEL